MGPSTTLCVQPFVNENILKKTTQNLNLQFLWGKNPLTFSTKTFVVGGKWLRNKWRLGGVTGGSAVESNYVIVDSTCVYSLYIEVQYMYFSLWVFEVHHIQVLSVGLWATVSILSNRKDGGSYPQSIKMEEKGGFISDYHGRMARGGHLVPNVSLGPAMPDRSMPCGWAGHPWNGLTAISGVACPQGRRPAAIFYPSGHTTPYACDYNFFFRN
jgi:hypothetical protein